MTHPACRGASDRERGYYHELGERLLDASVDMGTKLQRLFDAETTNFGLPYGVLSRVDPVNDDYHVEVGYGPHPKLQAGETLPLSETYCRKTVEEGTLRIDDAPVEGWAEDPAYRNCGFDTYVGTTVEADDEVYGTLCFASPEPRSESLTDDEVALVELLGQWASYELQQWSGPPTGADERSLEFRDVVRSPHLDSVLEALCKRPRRLVLTGLLDGPIEVDSVAEEPDDAERIEIRLRHVHLPKLEESGYVDWDGEDGLIRRGPSYPEAEPVLEMLGHGIEESHCE